MNEQLPMTTESVMKYKSSIPDLPLTTDKEVEEALTRLGRDFEHWKITGIVNFGEVELQNRKKVFNFQSATFEGKVYFHKDAPECAYDELIKKTEAGGKKAPIAEYGHNAHKLRPYVLDEIKQGWDFSKAVFEGRVRLDGASLFSMDFSRAHFKKAFTVGKPWNDEWKEKHEKNFDDSRFENCKFVRTIFEAEFCLNGATIKDANFEHANFRSSEREKHEKGVEWGTSFEKVKFQGNTCKFRKAAFLQVRRVLFTGAKFDATTVDFRGCTFVSVWCSV
jgi:uncharacterized protein YjbI with pentapeptide repeats